MLKESKFVIGFFVVMVILRIWGLSPAVAVSVSTDILDKHGAERALLLIGTPIVQIDDGLDRQLLLRRDVSVHAHGSIADVMCQAALHELSCDDVLVYGLAHFW